MGCGVPPGVRLSNFEDMRETGRKQGGLSRGTVSEVLVPRIEPPFFWLSDI